MQTEAGKIQASRTPGAVCTNVLTELNAGGLTAPGSPLLPAFIVGAGVPATGQIAINGPAAGGPPLNTPNCVTTGATITITSGPAAVGTIVGEDYPGGAIPPAVSFLVD